MLLTFQGLGSSLIAFFLIDAIAPVMVKASYDTAVFTGYNEYCALLRTGSSKSIARDKGVEKGIKIWPEYTTSIQRERAYRSDVIRMINERGCETERVQVIQQPTNSGQVPMKTLSAPATGGGCITVGGKTVAIGNVSSCP
jgi:hypothetical protein